MTELKLSDLIVSTYLLSIDADGAICVELQRVEGKNGVRWAIREHGHCLNKKGKWEYEPMPSSRTEAFFKRCRFATAEDALKVWNETDSTSRFSHYRTKKPVT